MAKCDQGYLCEVCGTPVKSIVESSLYLQYVLGEVELQQLFGLPERHLSCDPERAQYIEHEKFPYTDISDASKSERDPKRVERVTAAWLRLREVVQEGIPITDYPLPQV